MERATISGDPTKPGLYVIQVKFPRHDESEPLSSEDRHVAVLKGTWLPVLAMSSFLTSSTKAR